MRVVQQKWIPAQKGDGFELKRGQFLKVIDPEGSQVSDLFCFDRSDPRDSLSSGRSMDYADTLFLTEGHDLYSHRSEKLLRIAQDTCGRHDFLMTPCSLRMFQIVSGSDEHHPSCHENLALTFARFDIGPDRISTTFNLFMNVEVTREGGIRIAPPRSKAGDFVLLEAYRDLIVGLTACSHEETNQGRCKPIRYEILEARG